MKRKTVQLCIALLSTAAVGLIALVDLDRTSPGPLTAVHQREEKLDGKSGCSQCHGGWFSDMTSSCLECHDAVKQDIAKRHGLHGSLDKQQAQRCAQCHSEHHDAAFAIVNAQSFRAAGAPDPTNFDHNLVGFAMDGAHLELECAECHKHANEVVLTKGQQRYMGLDQNCVTCHEDVHKGQFVLDCASCHGQATWDGLHSLGHEKRLPLIGGHGDVGCRECHAKNDLHSLETLGSREVPPRARECADCHSSPHATEFIANVAAMSSTTPGASCVVCHKAEDLTFRDPHDSMSAELHAQSGFSLCAPHDKATCADCHAPDKLDFAARYPGRKSDKCSACHEDPHGGQFKTGPFSTGDCIACHDREHWEPHTFTVEKHELASLDLTGKHLDTECNDCHLTGNEGEPRVFRGTPSDCDGCHKDAHEGFFDPLTERLPEVEHGDCARCHGTQTFADVPAQSFDHGRWTGFAIQGAHAQNDCDICHPLTAKPDDAGRRFGRVAEHFGTFDGCVTCHKDVHQGAFDKPKLPSELDGRTDCARCHVESSFRTFPRGFDHGLWTGFTLVGAHAEQNCSACHVQLRKPDAVGRTWGRANGPNCIDCHDDPHAAQFAKDGATDCARCHTSTLTNYVAFDHNRDSRFPLEGAHVNVACSGCHVPTTIGGVEAVRYKPLGTDCVDCHGVHEEVLLRRKPKKG